MRHALWAAIFLFGAVSTSYAEGPFAPFTIGNWNGGKFTVEGTNQFSHCVAFASYKSDITLFVSLAVDGSWFLGFQKDDWNYKPDVPVLLELSFDGSAPIRVSAYPSGKNMVKVAMPVNSTLINLFMEADVMNAYSGKNVYAFSLEGTKPLFQKLYQCWDTNRPKTSGQGVAKNRPDTKKSNPQVGSASPVPLSSTSEAEPAANSDAARERNKLIDEAVGEHHKCIRSQMREIVPYSDESAETLSQVVLTKCAAAEEKFVRLGLALFNTSRAEMEKIVQEALAVQKKNIVAEIVTFRAQLNKALSAPPKDQGGSQEKIDKEKKETGI